MADNDRKTPFSFSTWIPGLLRRHQDLWLAVAVVALLGLLVLRVPAPLLDGLLALNLTATILLLLATLYVPTAAALSTMPTLILLTTLFRLALNVSSTRLILLEGEAGRVIAAFGEFVVGGSYAVGAVVFLVIVIIQMLVVAKGGDRVAEISARFVLDAMPGKQMAIDNDLANHAITPEDARRRRQELSREAQVYGAMDGALKFVKGDAVAGLVIAFLNLVAGIAIGVLQKDLGIGEAAARYGLLTIGDGLVSQIPSIVTCLAAAILVTRVAEPDEAGSSQLGGQIGSQLLREPKTLAVAGSVMLALAGVGWWTDTFPWLPFSLVGGATAASAAWLTRTRDARRVAKDKEPHARQLQGSAPASSTPTPDSVSFQPQPLVLVLEQGLGSVLAGSAERMTELKREISAACGLVQARHGVPLPPVPICFQRGLGGNGYQILANGGLLASGQLTTSTAFVRATPEQLTAKKLTPLLERRVPGTRVTLPEISASEADAARAAGFQLLTANAALQLHLAVVLQENLGRFVTVEATQRLLDALAKQMQTLVQSISTTVFKTHEISELLRLLAEEQVPIVDLCAILESMLRWAGFAGRDFQKLLELVRQDVRSSICGCFSRDGRELAHYVLAPSLEERLLAQPLAAQWSRVHRAELVQAVARSLHPTDHLVHAPVLLVPAEVRRTVFELLRDALSEVRVMAYEEMTQAMTPLLLGVCRPSAAPAEAAR